jgi:hypothetical protein
VSTNLVPVLVSVLKVYGCLSVTAEEGVERPFADVAITTIFIDVPVVRPVTVIADPDLLRVPTFDVAAYPNSLEKFVIVAVICVPLFVIVPYVMVGMGGVIAPPARAKRANIMLPPCHQ